MFKYSKTIKKMSNSTIFSIGHGTKKIETFIEELQSFNILFLIDVRTSPYSKYNPQYNKEQLLFHLKEKGITYVFLGDKLGGLPRDRSCYSEGKVDYNKVKDKNFFTEGLSRLLTANSKKINVAMMCSETKPQECHRSKLIGRELMNNDISVNHIVSKGKLKDQKTVMLELTKGLGETDLFGNSTLFTSRKKYI